MMSKVDAIRAALAEGLESPEQATKLIRKRFGIEISRQHFSATKSQLKRREGGGSPERAGAGRRASGRPHRHPSRQSRRRHPRAVSPTCWTRSSRSSSSSGSSARTR